MLLVIAVLVGAIALGWLVWAGWFHSTPRASSQLATFAVVDTHTATAVVDVQLEDATDANCRVRALAEDHVVVGELNFEPQDGRNEVTIRTERKASSVDLVGCTAEGQARPQ